MKRYPITVAVAVLALGAGTLFAAARSLLQADIPNAFTVAGDNLPAGRYQVALEEGAGENVLSLRNDATGKKVLVECVTRLARRDADQAELVFDKVGEQLYLSEIHLLDSDGYLLAGAPKQHTHVRLEVAK